MRMYSESIDRLLNKTYHHVVEELSKTGKLSTFSNYQYSLSVFFSFLERRGVESLRGLSVRFFSEDVLNDFYHWLLNTRKVASCNTVFANIRGLLKRISKRDVSFANLYQNASSVKTSRTSKTYVGIIDDSDLQAIIDAPGMDTDVGIRYSCIFFFLSTSGLRISEALSIRMKDLVIVPQNPYVKVVGKGGRRRTVPIANQAVPLLVEYIRRWHGESPNQDAYLFYSPRFGQLEKTSRAGIHKQLKQYARKAIGDEKAQKLHLHQFRHTAASKWFENGINYPQVSKILGHADLSITKTYVKISKQLLLDNINKGSLGISGAKKTRKIHRAEQAWIEDLFK